MAYCRKQAGIVSWRKSGNGNKGGMDGVDMSKMRAYF